MVGIREKDLHAETFKILLRLALHGSGCADRHECGRLDDSVRGGEASKARAGRIRGQNFETKTHPWQCIRSWRVERAGESGGNLRNGGEE